MLCGNDLGRKGSETTAKGWLIKGSLAPSAGMWVGQKVQKRSSNFLEYKEGGEDLSDLQDSVNVTLPKKKK